MYPETNPAYAVEGKSSSNKLESIAFFILLASVILAPLAFWPTRFIAGDLVKTFIIVLGSLIPAILLAITAIREKKLELPSKNLSRTAFLLGASLVVSSISSITTTKSLFGQGFEVGTAGFILALFVGAYAVFRVVMRKPEKAVVLYVGMAVAFAIIFILQAIRFTFGADFATLGTLNTITSSLIGSWFNLGIFSVLIALVSFIGAIVLPLSRFMKFIYWIIAILGLGMAIVVNAPFVWPVATLVLLGLVIHMTKSKPASGLGLFHGLKRVAWLPAIALVVFAVLAWKGSVIMQPINSSLYKGYSEIALPWQMTLDVTSQTIKNYPLFGVGPNNFSKAYMAYKPAVINSTDAWSLEFSHGFSAISTYVTTQGMIGLILWILFFVFFGISGARALKNLPEDKSSRFIVLSSFTGASFLWIIMLVYVPSHAVMFMTFVLTGIFLGSIRAYGIDEAYACEPRMGSKMYRLMPTVLSLLVVVGAVWGLMYVKKTVALGYFGGGVKELSRTDGDISKADSKFKTALAFDTSEIFWQARAEAALMQAGKIANEVNASQSASSSEALVQKVVDNVNTALAYSRNAIALDKTNYYNYLSEARVSETAMNVKMDKAYENAVEAYKNAIVLNPYNPSLYLALAKVQAAQGKFDESLKSIGGSLNVKNNYLDAIFLLSQVNAAKGNLADAITAAKVAIQINPNNSILQFQLGLLEFNNKNYQASADSLKKAVEIQPDYANARYFLGLANARLGKNDEAIEQFAQLAISNPDNQEVSLILSNLKAGKAIFADAPAPVTSTPEKRSSLPVKER